MSFREYVLISEGVLPDRPPQPGVFRISIMLFQYRRRTRTLRPRMVKVGRTPTVKSGRVAKIRCVPMA